MRGELQEEYSLKTYKIGEIAKMLGISTETIRNYEKKGLVKIGTASESARYNLPVQTDTLPFLQRLTDKSVVKAALKSGLKGQLSSAIDFLKRIINH